MVFATGIFIIIWVFGPGHTVIQWIRTANEIEQQEKQMEYYRREIEKMDKNIQELETNRDTLEKFARERFKFAAPDEDVYIVE